LLRPTRSFNYFIQKTSNLSGATLQIVTTNGGDYYGPVVLGWKSKQRFTPNLELSLPVRVNTKSVLLSQCKCIQDFRVMAKVKKRVKSVSKKQVVQ
jgi:hypothetical protein